MKDQNLFRTVSYVTVVSSMLLTGSGCALGDSTAAIPTVEHFELERYLGKWYEIARLPHCFEKGLDNVTADYSLRRDGKVAVHNSGLKDGKRRCVKGIAIRGGRPDQGFLKVSFFRPFYGEYRIIMMDPDYSWAVVTGETNDYLWILSRSSTIRKETLSAILKKLRYLKFDVSRLEYPWHDPALSETEIPECGTNTDSNQNTQ